MSSPSRSDHLIAVGELVHEEQFGHDGQVLVGVRTERAHVDIACWKVPGGTGDPLGALIGWVAPEEWDLFGLSGTTDGPLGRVTILVDRSGRVVGVGDAADGGSYVMDPPDGLITDLLLRCMRLPAPPPRFGVGAWADAIWVDAIADAALTGSEPLTWPDLAAMHPFAPDGAADAPDPTGGTRAAPDGDPAPPHVLRAATEAFSKVLGWERLLAGWKGIEGRVEPPGGRVLPETEWFDPGTFSRWHLACVPSLASRMIDLSVVLPRDLLDDVRAALAEGCP